MTPTASPPSIMRERQEPLRARYRTHPADALIVDGAWAAAESHLDVVHGRVHPGGQDYGVTWDFGIHRAVGGDHDLPNPGDILCAALAGCFNSTIRMIADRMGLPVESLEVQVAGNVDVRGTLRVDQTTPVGFLRLRLAVTLVPGHGVAQEQVERLLAAAEYSCVVLQTLRHGVEVVLEPGTLVG